MESLMNVYNWVMANKEDMINVVAYLVLAESNIVKLTPTLKDDNYFKPIIKFIGKYIALDKYSPKGD